MKEQGDSQVSVHINGIKVSVEEGTTLLQAANSAGIEIPTLCWAENLTPANACRLCVVEQKGSRTLVSSCSRVCEDGAQILTDTDRVRRSRKMVLEFLASSNDLSQSPDLVAWSEMYGADTERYQTPAKVDDQIKIEDETGIVTLEMRMGSQVRAETRGRTIKVYLSDQTAIYQSVQAVVHGCQGYGG